jgi:C-terminal processing protease CtpA/Prc
MFTFQGDDGQQQTRSVAAEPGSPNVVPAFQGAPPVYLDMPQRDHWFRYLADSGTLYVRYLRCQDATGFAAFVQELASTARSAPANRVVLDLRGNGGGSTAVVQPFVDWVRSSPLNVRGRFFVIVDRGTFSSGMDAAIQLAGPTRATLVGEPTGGKPNSYGEVKTFQLGNSGLVVQYATEYFSLVPGNPPSLEPAVRIEPSFADYAAARDPVLDAIVAGRAVA